MIRELKEKLEGSKLFSAWKAKNKGAFFFLVFAIFEPNKEPNFELSYYFKKKTTSFSVEPKLKQNPADEILSGQTPEKLELDKVSIDEARAVNIARKLLEKEYSSELASRTIMMLQSKNKQPFWNVTFFTLSYSTLNIMIDAVTGEVKEHSLKKLFDFVK